jgi:hypothetical protein
MSVDLPDAPIGADAAAGALIARAAAASRRANAWLRAAANDLAMPDAARLDDEARTAIRADLDRLVGAIDAELRHYAGRPGAGRNAAALAPSDGLAERMIAAGLFDDEALMRELSERAWCTIIAARLPPAVEPGERRPSLLPRLANGPDRVIASAAGAMLAADARRRGGGADTGRDDLPAELHHRLVWWVAAALRPSAPAAAVDLALIDGARRALGAHDEGARLEATADRLVLALDPKPATLPELIEAALDDRRIVLIAALIAHAAGLDSGLARTLLLDPAGDRLWLVLRALDLPRATIVRLAMALGEADRRRDPGRFIASLDGLMALPVSVAAEAVAGLKLPAVYRDARDALELAG